MLEGVFIGLIVAFITALLLYLYRTYTFWTRRGVKQISPIPLFGSFLPIILGLKGHGEVYQIIYNTYPDSDAVGYYQFMTPKLMIRNPALVKRVLVSDFSSFRNNEVYTNLKLDPYVALNPFLCRGEQWKTARTTFTAGISVNKLKSYVPLMKDTLSYLDEYLKDNLNKELETKDFSNNFFMTNVSNIAYGLDSNCFADPNAVFRKMVDLLSKGNWQRFITVIFTFFLQPFKIVLGISFIPAKLNDYGAYVMRKVTEDRLQSGKRRNDYVQYYLDRDNTVEEKMYELTNHAMSFFIGGMETSSITASNAVHELALHQDIQDRLYLELKEAYEKHPDMDYNTLVNLPYLEMVFCEVGRKDHVFYTFPKVCTQSITFEVDGNDLTLSPGQLVMIPCRAIQLDPKYYPNPEILDPERFTEENKAQRPETTFMPFGEGPRTCAGIQFGILQVKIFIAHLVYNYRILPTARSKEAPSYLKSAYFVIPNGNQCVQIARRT